MVSVCTLKQDCTRLNERQDKILQLFGYLLRAKYEVHQHHTPSHGKDDKQKKDTTEVFIDVKWEPLLKEHKNLVRNFTSYKLHTTAVPAHFSHALQNLLPLPGESNFPEVKSIEAHKRAKRILSSSVSKYLISIDSSKGFGTLELSNRNLIENKRALLQQLPNAVQILEDREHLSNSRNVIHLIDIANATHQQYTEWRSKQGLHPPRKCTVVRRFISNSPSFFSSSVGNTPPLRWTGFIRSEIRKAATTVLERKRRRGKVDLGNARDSGSDSDDTQASPKSRSKEETNLRSMISSLDEKLRDLKKKYAEEMRRSLHIQSELMKAESEKLDMVEHFSRLLEEKDIELGFLQKSARGEENRDSESYFGNVIAPKVNKDFFDKGIFEKEAKVTPYMTKAAAKPISPTTPKNLSSALSPSSSASSVADIMHFEAALEHILPDLNPSTGVGNIDKELFERFVMGSEGEVLLSPPNISRSSPSKAPVHSPRSTKEPQQILAQTPTRSPRSTKNNTPTPHSTSRTPRGASSYPTTPSSSHSLSITPQSSRVGEESVSGDSDFDEFAEFAEYQDYEVEDAVEPVEDGLSNRSRASENKTLIKYDNLSHKSTGEDRAFNPTKSDTKANQATHHGDTKLTGRHSDTKLASRHLDDAGSSRLHEEGELSSLQNDIKLSRADSRGEHNFAQDLDRYMDMDLQALMNLVNEKYQVDDSEEEVDPVDIEELKKQYGFDD